MTREPQILEPIVKERVALHVEEHVAGGWLGQVGEPAALLWRQQLVAQLSAAALIYGQTRVRA